MVPGPQNTRVDEAQKGSPAVVAVVLELALHHSCFCFLALQFGVLAETEFPRLDYYYLREAPAQSRRSYCWRWTRRCNLTSRKTTQRYCLRKKTLLENRFRLRSLRDLHLLPDH